MDFLSIEKENEFELKLIHFYERHIKHQNLAVNHPLPRIFAFSYILLVNAYATTLLDARLCK